MAASTSRYDKYEPRGGGFRATLVAATLSANVGNVLGVSLDANGKVVIGTAGNSGFVGVLVANQVDPAGTVVDVMTDGDIVDVEGLSAGTKYYATATTGVLTATATNNFYVGHTVEAGRLVVRVAR